MIQDGITYFFLKWTHNDYIYLWTTVCCFHVSTWYNDQVIKISISITTTVYYFFVVTTLKILSSSYLKYAIHYC